MVFIGMSVCLLSTRGLVWFWEYGTFGYFVVRVRSLVTFEMFPCLEFTIWGLNALMRPICNGQFSTCTTKRFDTPRAYTDWKFVSAQIFTVMGFGNNYLCWLRDFLFWSIFYLHHQMIWYTQGLYGLKICFRLNLYSHILVKGCVLLYSPYDFIHPTARGKNKKYWKYFASPYFFHIFSKYNLHPPYFFQEVFLFIVGPRWCSYGLW